MKAVMRRLALLLLLAPAPALAQRGQAPSAEQPRDPRTPPQSTIMAEPVALFVAAADADGDARVTSAELTAEVARSFAAADGARQGSLGYIAFADWAARWLGDRTALPSPFDVDADQDDRITLAELQAAFARDFARFDRDKDGAVTRQELLTLTSGFGRGGFGEGPGGGRFGGRGGRGGRR
ncbi:MAG: EF-hand domain-containing protein [Sphingomonas sp.]|nr:EF-hand domain-containing protein [Sphingomonas sp.]